MSVANLDCVELRNRTGRGVAILVEGEEGGDVWFYRQWFGNRPVAFFAQGSWYQVGEAVIELRIQCPDIPIYGIIDRDFAEDSALEVNFDSQGVVRTPLYTIENYLLDPNCWAKVFDFIFRRSGRAPDGWDEPLQVWNYIEQVYSECLPLAAHNWVVKFCGEKYQDKILIGGKQFKYLESPMALSGRNAEIVLLEWGRHLGIAENLGDLFTQKLGELRASDFAGWQKQVSGKYVLRELHRRFPLRKGGTGRFDVNHYVDLLLQFCPEPPEDLDRLIRYVLQRANQQYTLI
jgi:hypothetical protein